tara:strand:- start:296 stop:727 length:432 start_codon:yes stop_codon:yes gene_type:complete
MKIYFSSILAASVLFFAPISGIILIVGLSTIVDSGFGMWRAYSLGESVTSKIFRHGFVPKLLSYIGAVMLVYASDVFILNALTQLVISVEFLSTKIIALVLISIEVKSMDESFIDVKGYSFIEKARKVISKFKDIKKELKTIK